MSFDQAEVDRMKAKIQKLMNLAEKSSNENEAASALAKARSLMDKYELTQIDILEVDGVKKEFMEGRATRTFAACPKHIDILAVAVATFNDCQAVRNGEIVNYKKKEHDAKKYGYYIIFRGLKTDVEMALDMMARLMTVINDLCDKYLIEIGHEGKYPVGIGSKFKYGCASGICNKLKEFQKERDLLTTSAGTGLVLAKGNMVAEYFGNVKYGKSKVKMDSEQIDHFREGKARGQRVEVVKSVTN